MKTNKIPKIESNCTAISRECKNWVIIDAETNIFSPDNWILRVWEPIVDQFGYFIHRVPKTIASNVDIKQANKIWKKLYTQYVIEA